MRDCDVLIFDEPTRGIDVGAKEEIYSLLAELAAQGKAIIMISSELPEVLRLSHRIAVMAEGRLTAVLEQRRGHTGERHGLCHPLQLRRDPFHMTKRQSPVATPPATPAGEAALDRTAFGRERLRGSLQQVLAFASLIVILIFFSIANQTSSRRAT